MEKTHYIISDAAKKLHVEPHVLRYWEEELDLAIPRNNMGHRIYGEKELSLFVHIMKWKEEGFSLKEIQNKVTRPNSLVIPYPNENNLLADKPDASEDMKMKQFKQILGRIVTEAIRDNSEVLTTDIANNVSEHVNKELDFLFREKEESDEKRFRQLDETIRSFQKARQEAAAAEITDKRKARRRLRHKK